MYHTLWETYGTYYLNVRENIYYLLIKFCFVLFFTFFASLLTWLKQINDNNNNNYNNNNNDGDNQKKHFLLCNTMYEEIDSGAVGCWICWIPMRRGGIDNEHHNKNVNHISICYLEYVGKKNVLKIVNPCAQTRDELMDVETCSCTNLKLLFFWSWENQFFFPKTCTVKVRISPPLSPSCTPETSPLTAFTGRH